MRKQITIQSFTEIKTSKAQRNYFTLQDMEQQKYLCFIPSLRDYLHLGATIDAEIEPAKAEGDSPRLENIYVDDKPVHQEVKKTTGRIFGKSREELAQLKDLAQAQNSSIQAQTALNRVVDLIVAGKIDLMELESNAYRFYQLLQSLMKGEKTENPQKELQKMIVTQFIKAKREEAIEKTQPDKKAEVSKEVVDSKEPSTGDDRAQIVAIIKRYAAELGWIAPEQTTQGKKLGAYIVQNFKKKSISDLTDDELIELENSLRELVFFKKP